MTVLIDKLTTSLQSHKATTVVEPDNTEAAVAMVLQQTKDSLSVLFIKRASHPNDPWSGHIAFPGGRMESSDPGLQRVAERETREELNIDLSSAILLGRLDDQQGRKMTGAPRMTVACFVYTEADISQCQTNHEIDTCFWVPVDTLRNPNSSSHHVYHDRSYPAIELSPHGNLWGLTHRFLQNFLHITELKNT